MEYDYSFQKHDGEFTSAYVSEILGADPVYRLKRLFLDHELYSYNTHHTIYFPITNNSVYEIGIKRYSNTTKQLISTTRAYIVVFDDEFYELTEEEVTWDYILFTLFNIRVQRAKGPLDLDLIIKRLVPL